MDRSFENISVLNAIKVRFVRIKHLTTAVVGPGHIGRRFPRTEYFLRCVRMAVEDKQSSF